MPIGTARVLHYQQITYFRKRINYNDPGIGAGVFVGTLPAGAIIVDTMARVNTAFNAGTTNTVAVGTTTTGSDVMTSAEITPGTVGGRKGTVGLSKTFAVDTDLFVSYVQAGTAATAGQVDVVISYVPNNDQ